MGAEIGLIGFPVETLEARGFMDEFFISGITDKTRELILRGTEERGIAIDDLGEFPFEGPYVKRNLVERLQGTNYPLNGIRLVDTGQLEEARQRFLQISKKYDLLVAVGLSHLGGAVLYEVGDRVARLDYHADFFDERDAPYDFSCYMDWVNEHLGSAVQVMNYFVRFRKNNKIFGGVGRSIDDEFLSQVNHFDIDCFDMSHGIQDHYQHSFGPSGVSPEMVLSMIGMARLNKLGIWEYRHDHDSNGNGIGFIVSAIDVTRKELELPKSLLSPTQPSHSYLNS